MNAHTPGPWIYAPSRDDTGELARVTVVAHCCGYVIGLPTSIPGGNYRDGDPSGDDEADARLIAAAPELLALAHQYAEECGECAGTRVCPDDEPCTECADIWAVIDKAEGRT